MLTRTILNWICDTYDTEMPIIRSYNGVIVMSIKHNQVTPEQKEILNKYGIYYSVEDNYYYHV
jgi:hypothetical protein